jgi:hypothetical protein
LIAASSYKFNNRIAFHTPPSEIGAVPSTLDGADTVSVLQEFIEPTN